MLDEETAKLRIEAFIALLGIANDKSIEDVGERRMSAAIVIAHTDPDGPAPVEPEEAEEAAVGGDLAGA